MTTPTRLNFSSLANDDDCAPTFLNDNTFHQSRYTYNAPGYSRAASSAQQSEPTQFITYIPRAYQPSYPKAIDLLGPITWHTGVSDPSTFSDEHEFDTYVRWCGYRLGNLTSPFKYSQGTCSIPIPHSVIFGKYFPNAHRNFNDAIENMRTFAQCEIEMQDLVELNAYWSFLMGFFDELCYREITGIGKIKVRRHLFITDNEFSDAQCTGKTVSRFAVCLGKDKCLFFPNVLEKLFRLSAVDIENISHIYDVLSALWKEAITSQTQPNVREDIQKQYVRRFVRFALLDAELFSKYVVREDMNTPSFVLAMFPDYANTLFKIGSANNIVEQISSEWKVRV